MRSDHDIIMHMHMNDHDDRIQITTRPIQIYLYMNLYALSHIDIDRIQRWRLKGSLASTTLQARRLPPILCYALLHTRK